MSIANATREINWAGGDESPACPYCGRLLHGRWLPRNHRYEMRWKCFRCNDLWWEPELTAAIARAQATVEPLTTNGFRSVRYDASHRTAFSSTRPTVARHEDGDAA